MRHQLGYLDGSTGYPPVQFGYLASLLWPASPWTFSRGNQDTVSNAARGWPGTARLRPWWTTTEDRAQTAKPHVCSMSHYPALDRHPPRGGCSTCSRPAPAWLCAAFRSGTEWVRPWPLSRPALHWPWQRTERASRVRRISARRSAPCSGFVHPTW